MNLNQIHQAYTQVAAQVFEELAEEAIALAKESARRIEEGGKILVCGNGGSAGDAQHLVGELMNRFLLERRPYPGLALTTDTSVMTAISNDYSYEDVFAKQVEGLGTGKDVFIGISTSGNAENVCRAARKAKALGLLTIAMTGGSGGALLEICDRNLSISCTPETPRIQEGHGLLIHLFCEQIEETLES